jgi:hypothetical protein
MPIHQASQLANPKLIERDEERVASWFVCGGRGGQGNHAVLEALHALSDGKVFSERAQISANGALMALEGRAALSREPEPAREGDDGSSGGDLHLMMSYQVGGALWRR